jgi:hypothetical protein
VHPPPGQRCAPRPARTRCRSTIGSQGFGRSLEGAAAAERQLHQLEDEVKTKRDKPHSRGALQCDLATLGWRDRDAPVHGPIGRGADTVPCTVPPDGSPGWGTPSLPAAYHSIHVSYSMRTLRNLHVSRLLSCMLCYARLCYASLGASHGLVAGRQPQNGRYSPCSSPVLARF